VEARFGEIRISTALGVTMGAGATA
jgi:hypothetical protein